MTQHPLLKPYLSRQYGRVATRTVTDGQATREGILAAKQFLTQSGVDDTVVLFVAGHGVLDTEYAYHFGTHDFDPQRPAHRGLPFDDLNELLAGIRARHKLFLIDSCHAGKVEPDAPPATWVTLSNSSAIDGAGVVKVRSLNRDRGPGAIVAGQKLVRTRVAQEQIFADLSRGTGAIVIAACSGAEYSLEGPEWQNGVFTFCVLECLRSMQGDVDRDNRLHVSELRDYVSRRVVDLTQGGQHPTVRQENLSNDFPILVRRIR